MALLVNLRHLAGRDIALAGEISVLDLDIDTLDEMIRVNEPLKYDIVVERANDSILVRGSVEIGLDCQCVRCLRAFRHLVSLRGTICNLSLLGEEAVTVVNDCVDLTPYLREDILLEFPQHPVCGSTCPGLPAGAGKGVLRTLQNIEAEGRPSAWAELNKLKF